MSMINKIYTNLLKIDRFFDSNRVIISFIGVSFFILISDYAFNLVFDRFLDNLNIINIQQIELNFSPEVWTAVIALVLGTLIIVITLAAENTPELMDIFVREWTNLIFVWFLILSSLHSVYAINILIESNRISSGFLNTFIFLPIASIYSLPYIFKTLLMSKDINVVKKISLSSKSLITSLNNKIIFNSLNYNVNVEFYQIKLLKIIDQLDDLISTVQTKNAKILIINELGSILRLYAKCKSSFNKNIFNITESIIKDGSFKTLYTENNIGATDPNFFEKKMYSIFLFNYIQLNHNKHLLASTIVSEIIEIGKDLNNNKMVKDDEFELLIINLNTIFRHTLKHAYKNNEPRNLYNLAFHYSNLIQFLVKKGMVHRTKYCYNKFKFYANDIYKNAIENPSLYLIVDTLVYELKNCQILIHELEWSKEDQLFLLNILLQLDKPVGYSKDKVDKHILGVNSGTRRIQIGLALFYLSVNNTEFVEIIINDYLDDLQYFDKNTFKKNLDKQCFLLSIFGPTFWENTDRGNMNIYYSEYKDQIEPFKKMMLERLEKNDNKNN